MTKTIERLAGTINDEAARHAHYANSFRTYKEGEHRQHFEEAAHAFVQLVGEEKLAKYPQLLPQLEKILSSLAAWFNKKSSIEAMCPSVMISGGANFPTKKKERQNSARSAHWEAYEALKARAEKLGRYEPKDAEATSEKLAELLALHASCIACNKHYRSSGTLEGFAFVNEKQERDARFHIDRLKMSQPFDSYNLTNLKGKIKRLQENQEAASRSVEDKKSDFFRIETSDERINLYLAERLDPETFALFRKNGFLWSRKNQCFTRQNTLNAHHSLRRLNQDLQEKAAA